MKSFLSICFSLVQLSLFLQDSAAFVSPSVTSAKVSFLSSTDPSIITTSSTELNAFSKRREVFGRLKRLVFAGGIATSVFQRESALAEESPTTGRIVEFVINNVDGEVGKTGKIKIQLRPEWAPKGVARFEELTEKSFWKDCRVFRVLPGFVAQFGINGNPSVQAQWRAANIPDDPVKVTNKRGTVVFATAGPNTRTTQIFINTRQHGNDFLDRQGFSPIGEVIEGMDIVDKFYAGYGEGAPAGKGPNQGLIQMKGNSYLEQSFPKLSYISQASFVE